MKKITAIFLSVMMVFVLTACGNNSDTTANGSDTTAPPSSEAVQNESQPETPEVSQENDDTDGNSNILIAYFSRVGENYNVGYIEQGNTHIIAEMIAEQNGGPLFHIETVVPYPENYRECTDVAQKEKNDNARPELTQSVENMDDYDVVFLGYPNWWGDMPMAVYTFLESYDFSGKTIIPFCTHEGSGLSGTVQSISNTCTGAEVLSGLSIQGKTAQESRDEAREAVSNWLSEIGIMD